MKKHYYCMMQQPAPAKYVPLLMEKAEEQGWVTEQVMFCGLMPVSALDIKQQAATPTYVLIFSKWGEKEKAPALPNMQVGPDTKLPDSAVPDDAVDGRR